MAVTTGAMLALSTGVSVLGQVNQGIAQKRAADTNAQADELLAKQSQEAAKQEAKRIRRAGERQAGAARAQFAASGIDVNSGTPVLIEEDIYQGSESDAYNTLLTGERKASSLNRSASNTRAAGRSALSGSLLSAGATALQGWRGVKPTADPISGD